MIVLANTKMLKILASTTITTPMCVTWCSQDPLMPLYISTVTTAKSITEPIDSITSKHHKPSFLGFLSSMYPNSKSQKNYSFIYIKS